LDVGVVVGVLGDDVVEEREEGGVFGEGVWGGRDLGGGAEGEGGDGWCGGE